MGGRFQHANSLKYVHFVNCVTSNEFSTINHYRHHNHHHHHRHRQRHRNKEMSGSSISLSNSSISGYNKCKKSLVNIIKK